ncbi:MAG: NAD(P)(+) transhydrogenase (Re/Si-specific) subunit alpha [Flavobacteriales bacterium]|nr:Re/Si-specific NAD(P)(+) transhydrogenase subunit alpha [Bacteroidales bacterium AH-315-I05]PCJ89350.1 MAG: NAD(P)(+) transhydrogenase (Re/Si-specific) subunit alpha [Flavobacteriales bacterium]
MKIGVPKETKEGENRVALNPGTVKQLKDKGFEVLVEEDAGFNSTFSNRHYRNTEVELVTDANQIYTECDVILKVNAPELNEIALMKKDSVLISFMYPLTEFDIVDACAKQGISSFAMDMVPRISRAQKMDALSSQTNLAAYKAILLGSNALKKVFPLLMTAAGTIKPAKVMIFGAGVAGLQAAATAKRLGAIVEVTDIRPETKEQVESLGAKFIEVEGDDSLKTEGGYVKEVSEEFLEKQKELVAKHVSEADLVITTALVPGKKAPVLITKEMVQSMHLGSVIVDMAVEQGGNCELSEMNKTVLKNGVTIIGESNLASLLPLNSSQMYAKNISELLLHLADKDGFKWEMDEEITQGSLITHKGEIVHPRVKKALQPQT